MVVRGHLDYAGAGLDREEPMIGVGAPAPRRCDRREHLPAGTVPDLQEPLG